MMPSISESLKATQDYLRSGKSLKDFNDECGIRGKTDGQHIILDYDQIKVRWSEPFGYACRGLVLNAETFDLIGLGLGKFFNSGEGHAVPIDWTTARVLEKLDGSMIMRWWSPRTNQFELTTRYQLPQDMVANTVGSFGLNWKQLFEMAFENSFDRNDPIFQNRDLTIVFEIMSAYNKIVVRHEKPHSAIIAIRNIRTLEEMVIPDHLIQPKVFSFSNVNEVQEFANTLQGGECEGFVVLDGNFNRIKIKGSSYVYLHRLKDSAQSVKAMIILARNGEKDEIVAYFPEYLPIFNRIEKIVEDFVIRHIEVYERLKHIETQKDFALAVQAEKIEASSLLFLTRAGKATSVRDALNNMEASRFIKLLKPLVEEAGLVVDEEPDEG